MEPIEDKIIQMRSDLCWWWTILASIRYRGHYYTWLEMEIYSETERFINVANLLDEVENALNEPAFPSLGRRTDG